MQFHIPVNIFEESGAVRAHAGELAALGRKALLVTGRASAVSCGALADVTAALAENGQAWVLFDRVEENPSVETVIAARDLGLAGACDFVIGIGGGSPMDAAKAAAFMMGYPEKGAEYLYEKGPDDRAFPIAEVPTTCGTGAEITWVSVLTRPALAKKGSIPHRLYPALALADFRYLLKAPESVIRNTAVDALCHLTESYVNAKATAFSRMPAREGLAVWAGAKGVLDGSLPLTEETAARLMHASVLAGMAITQTGTGIPHGLSYALTVTLGMPHGKACGYFLADYLAEAGEEDRNAVLGLTGFADAAEMKRFIWNVCGITPAPKELLRKDAEQILASPAKLESIPWAWTAESIYRIAGICPARALSGKGQ